MCFCVCLCSHEHMHTDSEYRMRENANMCVCVCKYTHTYTYEKPEPPPHARPFPPTNSHCVHSPPSEYPAGKNSDFRPSPYTESMYAFVSFSGSRKTVSFAMHACISSSVRTSGASASAFSACSLTGRGGIRLEGEAGGLDQMQAPWAKNKVYMAFVRFVGYGPCLNMSARGSYGPFLNMSARGSAGCKRPRRPRPGHAPQGLASSDEKMGLGLSRPDETPSPAIEAGCLIRTNALTWLLSSLPTPYRHPAEVQGRHTN